MTECAFCGQEVESPSTKHTIADCAYHLKAEVERLRDIEMKLRITIEGLNNIRDHHIERADSAEGELARMRSLVDELDESGIKEAEHFIRWEERHD